MNIGKAIAAWLITAVILFILTIIRFPFDLFTVLFFLLGVALVILGQSYLLFMAWNEVFVSRHKGDRVSVYDMVLLLAVVVSLVAVVTSTAELFRS